MGFLFPLLLELGTSKGGSCVDTQLGFDLPRFWDMWWGVVCGFKEQPVAPAHGTERPALLSDPQPSPVAPLL